MHRTIEAMTLAGAIGLSLASGSAGAQSQGWNLVRPQYCFEYSSSANGQITSTLVVYTQAYTFQVAQAMQTAVLQWCQTGAPFYAYNDGPGHPWWMFWIQAGLK